MHDLAQFQASFARALLQPVEPESPPSASALDLALRIHRNTTMKGLVDALVANYPTVAQLVGEDWFKACALQFARANPPRDPVLASYGESFPDFLATFPPARELPYLPDVARIDRIWIESWFAHDAPPLLSELLARLPAEDLLHTRLALHPATRFGWAAHSAATIWAHHRAVSMASELTLSGEEEGILLTRVDENIEHRTISRAAFHFLDRLARGDSLGTAAAAILELDAEADVAGTLAMVLECGAFTAIAEVQS